MNIILINEAKSKYVKSYVQLFISRGQQILMLATIRTLKLNVYNEVRVNIALPHSSFPIVFTKDFFMMELDTTELDYKTNLYVYTFTGIIERHEDAYNLPKTKVTGKVVFK